MSLNDLPAGKEAPKDIYVVVENAKHTPHIKYEVDKDTGLLFVDRFAPMPMVFPAHYGFINQTLGGDGDPVRRCWRRCPAPRCRPGRKPLQSPCAP